MQSNLVPMHSVMGVFQPEVHYTVQLCADPLSIFLQLQHCSFKKKKKKENQFVVDIPLLVSKFFLSPFLCFFFLWHNKK